MPTLVERLGAAPTRDGVIADCVVMIDNQVKSKSIFLRTAYGTVKAIKRGFVKEVVDGLLDEWLAKLQPYHDKWSAAKAGSFAEFLIARSDDVAEDLLSVTDKKAETTKHTTAKKLYLKFRDGAKKNVIEAIPELGKTIEKHLAAPVEPTKTAPASA